MTETKMSELLTSTIEMIKPLDKEAMAEARARQTTFAEAGVSEGEDR